MAYSECDLRAASEAGVLDPAQLARLIDFLRQRQQLAPPRRRRAGRRASMSRICSGMRAR